MMRGKIVRIGEEQKDLFDRDRYPLLELNTVDHSGSAAAQTKAELCKREIERFINPSRFSLPSPL
jgi:hypothetical protein